MNRTSVTSLAFAAACLTAVAAAPGVRANDMSTPPYPPTTMSAPPPGAPMPAQPMSGQMSNQPMPGQPMPPPMSGPGSAMNSGPMNNGPMNNGMNNGPMNNGPADNGGTPAQLVTNGPQADPGDDSGSRAAQQNVRESEQYDALVHSNPGFRASRMQKECGSINDPQLHQSCIASFGGGSESASMRSHRHHHNDEDN